MAVKAATTGITILRWLTVGTGGFTVEEAAHKATDALADTGALLRVAVTGRRILIGVGGLLGKGRGRERDGKDGEEQHPPGRWRERSEIIHSFNFINC